MILWKHNLFKWSVTILLARSPGLQSRRMLGEHSTIPKLLALSLTWKRCQLLILDEKINQRLWQSMNTSIPMTSKFGEKKMAIVPYKEVFVGETSKCWRHLKISKRQTLNLWYIYLSCTPKSTQTLVYHTLKHHVANW